MYPMNYRDVGDVLGLWLEPSPVPRRRLFRGGRLDSQTQPTELGEPSTILNLRRGADPTHLGATLIHVPASNTLENYDTENHQVAAWVRQALGVLADPAKRWPVYIHCTSGRDRTGVVVAAALLGIGVPREAVIEEYLLSDGADRALITRAIDGLAGFDFCDGCDPVLLRRGLSGQP